MIPSYSCRHVFNSLYTDNNRNIIIQVGRAVYEERLHIGVCTVFEALESPKDINPSFREPA